MLDYKKPIPKIEFLSNKLPVADPSDEPMVYMDDKFICNSWYNKWPEDNGNPLPGSSPSIMCRKTVFEMVEKAEALLKPSNSLTPHLRRSIIRLCSAYHSLRITSCFRHSTTREEPLT